MQLLFELGEFSASLKAYDYHLKSLTDPTDIKTFQALKSKIVKTAEVKDKETEFKIATDTLLAKLDLIFAENETEFPKEDELKAIAIL